MRSIFGFIIEPLAQILLWIQEFTGFSWGWSIVVLTIFVRILLIPLGVKQYTSMRGMQKLQPKIKEMQKKYKGDKQKLNEEMMKFYKENKVNPFGSCLPLLLQMPIFIALYLLLQDPDLYINVRPLVSKSWLWIDDITYAASITSDYVIIVLLYMGTQFLSGRLLATSTDKTQQMMMTVMPLFLGVIFLFYAFPAGVLIYWVTTNVWTIGQQLVTKRIITAREARNGLALATAGGGSVALEDAGTKGIGKKAAAKKSATRKSTGKQAAGKKKTGKKTASKAKAGGSKPKAGSKKSGGQSGGKPGSKK